MADNASTFAAASAVQNFSVVFYDNLTQTVAHPAVLALDQLRAKLTTHELRPRKDGTLFSPVTLKQGATTRANKNIAEVCALVADMDESHTLEEAFALCVRCNSVLYSTYRHGEQEKENAHAPGQRYRAVFFLEEPIPAEQFAETWERFNLWTMGAADSACKDISRAYYLPACPTQNVCEAVEEVFDGPLLRLEDLPELPPEMTQPKAAVNLPAAKMSGRPGDDFSAQSDNETTAAILEKHRFIVHRSSSEVWRVRRPDKEGPGICGTLGFVAPGFFFNFSSSAEPFNAPQTYSPYQVMALLEFGGDFAGCARYLGEMGYGKQAVNVNFNGTVAGKNGHFNGAAVNRHATPRSSEPSEKVNDDDPGNEPDGTPTDDGSGKSPTADLPKIETNNRQLRDKRADTIAALKRLNEENPTEPRLFHGDAGLVGIAQDKDGLPHLRIASREAVQDAMADAARWMSTRKVKKADGSWDIIPREIVPPRELAENYLVQRTWPGVPPVDGIATSPIVGRDASGKMEICTTPGYNPAARRYLHLTADFEMPELIVNAESVAQAKSLICKTLLGEVAFAENASRTHAVALMLLPFVRSLIKGPTPFHLIDAPTQGSGKSHCAKICISPSAVPTASVIKGEEEEWRKAIVAALLSGRSHVFYDNIKGQLSSAALAAALTEPSITERNMGGLGEVTVRINCTWVGTSNNARLDTDTASRCIVIRLDTGLENPESREYACDPLAYIAAHRGQVCGAILLLVKNWMEQGAPGYSGLSEVEGTAPAPVQSRFPAWQNVIGGILEANGIFDFLGNLNRYRDALNPERSAWKEFIEAWHAAYGTAFKTAAELLPLALENSEIMGGLSGKEGKGQVIGLGRMLQTRRDKVFGDLKLLAGAERRQGHTYCVASKAEADKMASGGLF